MPVCPHDQAELRRVRGKLKHAAGPGATNILIRQANFVDLFAWEVVRWMPAATRCSTKSNPVMSLYSIGTAARE
jgi:hypothetical protein